MTKTKTTKTTARTIVLVLRETCDEMPTAPVTYLSGGKATVGELCAAVRAARELRERLDAAIKNMESIIAEDWDQQSDWNPHG